MVRRLEQAEATAQRLLDAAWTRFSTLPYESVRLSDIAADAGVTVQTLHTRFGTKEELFTTALHRWMEEQGRRRSARVGDVDDIVRILHDNYDEQREIGLRIMAEENRIPAARQYMDSGRQWHRQWVANVFDPYLRVASPRARADLQEALIVTCDISTWKLLRVEMGHPPADARRIVRRMLRALVAPYETT